MRLPTRELDELRRLMAEMGRLAETAIHDSVRSLLHQDRALAEAVIREEPRINELEMRTDSVATRLLALYQPVAKDLRFLTVALRVTTDLERVGDLSVNIARRVLSLLEQTQVKVPTDVSRLAVLVESMLTSSLQAVMNSEETQALDVLVGDHEADRLRDYIYIELIDDMQRIPEAIPQAVDLIFVTRDLERMGDHATNIAEDAVYLVRAIDVRHHEGTKSYNP
jgi:phosphate transport system protein